MNRSVEGDGWDAQVRRIAAGSPPIPPQLEGLRDGLLNREISALIRADRSRNFTHTMNGQVIMRKVQRPVLLLVSLVISLNSCTNNPGMTGEVLAEAQPMSVLTQTPSPDSPQATATESPAATWTMVPFPTATPTRAHSSTPETPEDLARLRPGDELFFDTLHMIDPLVGWAISAEVKDTGKRRTYNVLRTEDGGHNWSEVTPPELFTPSNARHLVAQAYFLDGQRAWVMLVGGVRPMRIWRTTDGGLTWTSSNYHSRGQWGEGWPTLFFNNQNQGWLLVSYFQGMMNYEEDVVRTEDGGRTWESILLPEYQLGPIRDFDAVGATTAWITSGHGAGIYPAYTLHLTNDGGLSWEHVNPDPEHDGVLPPVDCMLHQPHVVSYLEGRVLRSCVDFTTATARYFLGFTQDGGRTWRYVEVPGEPFSLGDQHGWALGTHEGGAHIYRTYDGGNTWRGLSSVEWTGSLAFVDALHGWAVTDTALYHTSDGGRNWSELSPELLGSSPPAEQTHQVEIPAALDRIQAKGVDHIQHLAEFEAQNPTSMVVSRSTLYTGLADGRIIPWGWKIDSVIPGSMPRMRVSDRWIYDLAAGPYGWGFMAAAQDGHAYTYDDITYPELGVVPSTGGELSGIASIGEGLLTGGEDGVVRAWLRSSETDWVWTVTAALSGHKGWVWDVDASENGELYASGGADAQVIVWDAATDSRAAVLSGHTAAVTRVRFSPDSSLLATASRDGSVRLWDMMDMQMAAVFKGHEGWVPDLSFSPDGSLLASVDVTGLLILWDVQNATSLRAWQAHDGPARAVVFHPDGTLLFTAGDDDAVKIWGILPGPN